MPRRPKKTKQRRSITWQTSLKDLLLLYVSEELVDIKTIPTDHTEFLHSLEKFGI